MALRASISGARPHGVERRVTLSAQGLQCAAMPAPEQGTKAHEALAANAARKVTRTDKLFKRSKRKAPTKAASTTAAENGPEIVVPGKLITAENDMYIMSIGMMLGLRVSLLYNAESKVNAGNRTMTADDVHGSDKYVFPPEGMEKAGFPQTPRHHLSHTFKFKDYCPKVLHQVRLLSGIDTQSYMDSVCGDVNYVTFTTNSKSGQFFFFTPDGDYMIKTVSHEEVRELQKIVLQYYEYLQSHPRSFLCRILGMHRVQMYHLNRTIYFIVMASAYKGAPRKMDVQYDCKGSHVGRSAPQDSVKKDNDLLEEGFRLRLGSNREPVVAQVRADVEFLRNLGFLDYSLLIGATYKPVEEASGGGSGSGGAKDGENGASESGAEDETDEEDQEGEEDDGNGHVVAPTTNSKRASFVAPSAPPPPPPPAAAQSPAAATKPTASPKKKSWLFRSSDRRTSSGSAEGGGSNRGSLNHINSEAADVMAQALSPSASSVSSGSAASSDCPAGDPNGGGGGGDGGLRRPAEVLRRNSSRSLQLAYTKQWQSMKSLSALTEEKELMVEATRWSGGAEGGGGGGECGFTVAPSGGLPALPLPPDAPWLMPRKPNVAFEKALLGTATARGSGSGNGKGGEIRESKESFAMTSPMRGLRVSSLASGGGSGTASSDSSSSGAASYDDGIDEYRLGVIDFLTRYGVTKVAERNFKSFKYEKKGLSVAPPNEYAARLVAFVEGIALGDSPPKESNGGYWVQVTLTQAVSGIELGSKTETGAKLESQWKRASATATTTGVSPKLVTAGQLSQSMPASRSSDTAEDSSSSDFGGAMTGACVQSVAENSEAWLAGVRGGDRVHRVNGELVPLKESRRATMERLRRASRPLHLTLERFPTKAEEAKRDSSGRTSAGSEGTGSEGSDAAGRYSGTNVGSSVTAI